MISSTLLEALIWPALLVVSVSPIILIGLLLKDLKAKALW